MITINEYLENVADEFNDYLATKPFLCDLKTVDYTGGKFPDYHNIHVQQYYLLRYAYGYAFEYKRMYYNLFKREEFTHDIAVTSIGCGSRIDYWSLVRVLEKKSYNSCNIEYNGLDLIDWEYKIPSRVNDNVTPKNCNAIDEICSYSNLSSNVYIFPHSLSELHDDCITRLCNCFETKTIIQDTFHILISIRKHGGSAHRDILKSKKIMAAVCKNGFKTADIPDYYWYWENDDNENKGIKEADHDFRHPFGVINCTKDLYQQCAKYEMNSRNCDADKCRLNRWPIINTDNMKYQIFTFTRL